MEGVVGNGFRNGNGRYQWCTATEGRICVVLARRARDTRQSGMGISQLSSMSINPPQPVYILLKPTTAGLLFRTLTGTTRCLENSFLCLTYIAETHDVGDGTD